MTTVFNVRDFGAVGDRSKDDFPAFQLALKEIESLAGIFPQDDPSRGAVLFVPSGHYIIGQTLEIKRSIIIQGTGGWYNSLLIFSQGPGIIIHGSDGVTTAQRSVIRDIAVMTQQRYSPSSPPPNAAPDDDVLSAGSRSGIVLEVAAIIENCLIAGFEDDGIHINTSAPGRNANLWGVRYCEVSFNGRHGLFVTGGDSNGGSTIGVLAFVNTRWGFYDRSFLGNTYIGCYAEGNGNPDPAAPNVKQGGGYYMGAPASTANHTLVGCNAEQNETVAIKFLGAIIGGNLWAPPLINLEPAYLPVELVNNGQAAVYDLRVRGSIATNIRKVTNFGISLIEDSIQGKDRSQGDSVIIAEAISAPIKLVLPELPPLVSGAEFNRGALVGRHFTIKRVGSFAVTIMVDSTLTKTIDGSQSVELSTPNSWITLVSDGENWHVIGAS